MDAKQQKNRNIFFSFIIIVLSFLIVFSSKAEEFSEEILKPSNGMTGGHDETEEPSEEVAGSFTGYINKRLRVGVRTMHRVLTDGDSGHRGGWYGSGTFLGTIYGLDEEQNYMPFYFYVSWLHDEYVAIELAYDQIEAETKAMGLRPGQPWYDLKNGYTKTDGTAQFAGPVLSILFRYPNETSFTPYAGFGVGFYNASFDCTPEWENPRYNYHHVMEVDDTVAFNLTLGGEWSLHEHWYLDFSLQYVNATMDAKYTAYIDGIQAHKGRTGEFPMDNIAVRFGIAYNF